MCSSRTDRHPENRVQGLLRFIPFVTLSNCSERDCSQSCQKCINFEQISWKESQLLFIAWTLIQTLILTQTLLLSVYVYNLIPPANAWRGIGLCCKYMFLYLFLLTNLHSNSCDYVKQVINLDKAFQISDLSMCVCVGGDCILFCHQD